MQRESSSITTWTPPPVIAPAPVATFGILDDFRGHRVGQHAARECVGAELATDEATTTDANGFYRIGGLWAGFAQLIVAKEGVRGALIEEMISTATRGIYAVLVRQSESN